MEIEGKTDEAWKETEKNGYKGRNGGR